MTLATFTDSRQPALRSGVLRGGDLCGGATGGAGAEQPIPIYRSWSTASARLIQPHRRHHRRHHRQHHLLDALTPGRRASGVPVIVMRLAPASGGGVAAVQQIAAGPPGAWHKITIRCGDAPPRGASASGFGLPQ
jgi:hypothetical protein